jgi:Na+/H+ antiporter NhaD/arsenite permease-like protein
VFGVIGAIAQHRYSPIQKHAPAELRTDWTRAAIVLVALIFLVGANAGANLFAPGLEEVMPLLGLALWAALLLSMVVRHPDWRLVPEAAKGALFLVSLVAIASLMPVQSLPTPSWQTAFGLGLLSSVFDNIPLTALALEQGGYDWAMLAYAVGFGGSMVWFGSSAGVAITGLFPEGRSVIAWLRGGWHVALAYAIGFAVLLALRGWTPTPG